MPTTHWSITKLFPEIKPSVEFLDNGTKEQLYFVQCEDMFVSFLTRPTFQIVNEPEPGIQYSDWVLKAVAKRRAADHSGEVWVYHVDKASGMTTYIAPLGRIWVLGVKQGGDNDLRFTLPLKYWEFRHGNDNMTEVPLPNPSGGPLGLFVDVGNGS